MTSIDEKLLALAEKTIAEIARNEAGRLSTFPPDCDCPQDDLSAKKIKRSSRVCVGHPTKTNEALDRYFAAAGRLRAESSVPPPAGAFACRACGGLVLAGSLPWPYACSWCGSTSGYREQGS